MPRLFIYWIEAQQKEVPVRNILTEQLKLMAYRLWYIITWPSAILAILFALALLYLMPSWLVQSWMWIKLAFVGVLVIYHLKTHMIFRSFTTVVGGFLLYLVLAFWLKLKDMIHTKRSSVFDL